MKKRWVSSAHYGVTTSSRRHFLLRAGSSLHRSPCPPPPSRPPCSPSLSSSSPALDASVTLRRRPRPRKKKVKRLPTLPRRAGTKHFQKISQKIDSASTKQQQSGKTGREEERRADAGDVRPVTKTHCCLSRRGHRARAHPSLGRRRAQGASRPHLPSPVSAAGGQGSKGSILWIANEGVGPIDGSVLRGGCSARG